MAAQAAKQYRRQALLGVCGAGACWALATTASPVRLDTDETVQNAISVDSSIDPFPIFQGDPLLTTHQLLGWGIRKVSFLRMKVYALGLYIAKEDLPLTKQILGSAFLQNVYEGKHPDATQKEALEAGLEDGKTSEILIDNLLTSGVKFTARICPLRNTDLSHLRDGFIRTIRNSDACKQMMKEEDTAEHITLGLEQLRKVMNSHKMKAYKNSRVYMEIIDQGKLRVTVKVWDSNHFRDVVQMGVVEEPIISRLLFRAYLSGDNPLSKDARDQVAESLVALF